jgi:cytochrome b6-f complex iron-sulfur subunit
MRGGSSLRCCHGLEYGGGSGVSALVVGRDDWSQPGKPSARALSNEYDRINDLVDRLLAGKRLPSHRPGAEELEAIRVAIWLRAARPGGELPDPAFLERLGRKLRAEFGEVEPDRSRLTRRRILRTAAVTAGALVAGGAADRLQQGRIPPLASQQLVPDAGSWRRVAAASALPMGQALRFSTEEVHGIVVNEAGEVRALSGVCTHLGCTLTINVEARRLDCPCHDLAFSWNGSVLYYRLQSRPAALPQIPSRVRDGMIEVLLP